MPKYLIKASYTTEGLKGVLKEGGSGRKAAIQQLAESLGGTLEGFYFAFGDDDVYTIADLPDNKTAAAVALTATASGAVRLSTTVLLTPEEVDEATKQSVSYRAPGTTGG